MKNCNCHYEMPRDGSGQLGRYLNALDPSYAPIDGRSLEDLLVFAKRYAAQIRFYDIPESKIDGDIAPEHVSWREFFRRDMAVIAASISAVDLARLKRDYDQNREHLDSYPDSDALNDLFDPILGMIAQIDRWYSLAIPENPLHADLQLAIDSLLRDQVKKTAAYEEGYKYLDPKHPLQLDYSAIENDSLWGLDEEVNPDASIYQGANLDDQIRYAALFVDEIFHAVYGVMTDLVEVKSLGYMNFALQAYPSHQPHMALFIAFLELFRLAQQQMNGLTAKMLDFYYQDVLRLAVKPSIPDRAYVVFELAKDVSQYDIAQGSALKAGKDSAGKEQIYVTNTDLVVNQAKVKELKTLFIQKSPSAASVNGTVDAIFARPVANSLDGFGEKIVDDPSGKWPTFGKGMPSLQKAKNICQKIEQYKETLSRKDQAKIGFAVASPQLLLQGGNRLLEWHIDRLSELLPETDEGDTPHQVEIWLTGEKGWLVLSPLEEGFFRNVKQWVTDYGIFPLANEATKSGYFIDREANSFYIYLLPAEDAIIPFDAKLHLGYPYLTSYPVAQIMLGPNLVIDYDLFRGLSLSDQSISARVGSIVPAQADVESFMKEQKVSEAFLVNFLYDGLKKLVLQNETGLLPANKPFDPFTLYPGFGKSFYVGSDEIFNKPLSKLAIHIKNTQDPEVVDDESGPVITLRLARAAASASTNRDFKYSVSLLADKHWDQLYTEEPSWSFFRYQLAQNLLNHAVVNENESLEASPFTTERKPLQAVTEFKPETVKGFIRISNLKEIPTNGNIPAIQLSQEMAPKLQIKEISASYHSELTALDPEIDQFFHVYPFGVTEIFVGDVGRFTLNSVDAVTSVSTNVVSNFGSRQSDLFNRLDKAKDYLLVNADGALLPQFGYLSPNAVYEKAYPSQVGQVPIKQRPVKELASKGVMETLILEASGISQALLGGNNQYSALLQEEGMLFIGLEKLKPLDTLSLLFQFAEGSAADEDNDPPEIHWSYLTYNEWRPLKGENLISDGTYGFKTTGIIKIEVPQDSTDHNTIITDGLRWFCASVTEHADRIPMLVNVVAQAVETQFQDNANDQSHFDTALPAGSISKLAVAVAQVGKVEQPFASFDGKHREIGKEFYTRVSERLRHKARAITPWDYEHLVLDRFPSIYKVKCITHTDPNCLCRQPIPRPILSGESKVTCCGPQIAPGHVLIVPIANLKNRNAANPLQPKTSRRTLLEIEDYLSKRTSPFAHVHAKNPVYEQVLVFFRVQFVAGADKGYYLKKLNDEIVHYLTPWAFDEDAEVSFAQKIYASAVINFIEERSYVDFITDFLMFVCSDECCPEETVSVVNAAAGKSGKLADILSHISGCCDLEQIFANAPISLGKVIAEPSTSRSILVSYPRHIIIPYEAPVEESACEARKKSRAQVVAVGDRPLVEDTGNRIRLEAKARKPRRNR